MSAELTPEEQALQESLRAAGLDPDQERPRPLRDQRQAEMEAWLKGALAEQGIEVESVEPVVGSLEQMDAENMKDAEHYKNTHPAWAEEEAIEILEPKLPSQPADPEVVARNEERVRKRREQAMRDLDERRARRVDDE